MSIDAVSWAFRAPGVKDAYEKVVLLTLADFADDYGVCFPSVATIAERASCSVRKTRYCLAALEGRGLIHGISRRRSNGSQRSSAFILVGFGGRKIASRPDEHPVLEQLHLEGRLDWDAIRLHVVPPADRPERNAHRAAEQTAQRAAADCTPCSGRLHDRSQRTAQCAALEPSLEPSLEPPLRNARERERAARPSEGAGESALAALEAEVSSEQASAWLSHRRALGMPAMSVKQARLLAGELREVRLRGADPDQALQLAMARGWRIVRADWVCGGNP